MKGEWEMANYIARLTTVCSKAIQDDLGKQGIFVHHVAKLQPELIAFESDRDLQQLITNPLFRSVKTSLLATLDA